MCVQSTLEVGPLHTATIPQRQEEEEEEEGGREGNVEGRLSPLQVKRL